MMEALKILNDYEGEGENSSFSLAEWKDKCYAALMDDFNSPILIAHLFDVVKLIFSIKDGKSHLSTSDTDELKHLMHAFKIGRAHV